ncbi:MAG: tRNA (adenosine(37)-N6)-threonylcarbamoyltransferase complex dimerization subunit type 1 TsaB, partial [Deltaproteobacteria bacterium]
MKIFALDTSSTSGSIAILDGKTLLAEVTFGNVGAHSDWLLKNTDALFSGLGLTAKDMDLFAVAAGPGSFTGLRVGISAVKGMAWSLGKKVVGVSSLKALALNLRYSNMTVCPVLDARKSEIYTALYRYVNDTMYSILDDCLTGPERLLPVLVEEALAKPVVFIGP